MSVINVFEVKKAKQKSKELHKFLLTLDSICDQLYNNLNYDGVWESLMKLEDVRIKYYVEYFEYNKIVELKGKK